MLIPPKSKLKGYGGGGIVKFKDDIDITHTTSNPKSFKAFSNFMPKPTSKAPDMPYNNNSGHQHCSTSKSKCSPVMAILKWIMYKIAGYCTPKLSLIIPIGYPNRCFFGCVLLYTIFNLDSLLFSVCNYIVKAQVYLPSDQGRASFTCFFKNFPSINTTDIQNNTYICLSKTP